MVSCGGGSSAPPGPCAVRTGSYRTSFVERSGNCGPVPEQVSLQGSPSLAAGCGSGSTLSADNCTLTLDLTCQNPTTGSALVEKGVIHWSEDGAMGGGIVQSIISNAATRAIECESTYNVTYSRL